MRILSRSLKDCWEGSPFSTSCHAAQLYQEKSHNFYRFVFKFSKVRMGISSCQWCNTVKWMKSYRLCHVSVMNWLTLCILSWNRLDFSFMSLQGVIIIFFICICQWCYGQSCNTKKCYTNDNFVTRLTIHMKKHSLHPSFCANNVFLCF